MKCPKCPYYEQKTSYGMELIKCNNKCERKAKTMTREQAIAHGKEQLEIFGGEHREFIEKAIRALQQESILDKIRAEIEKTTSRYTISRERGAMGQVEWSDRLIKESEVLEIIDKYKAESEDKI